MRVRGNIKATQLHTPYLYFHDSAIFVIEEGVAIRTTIGNFLYLPYLLLFDICFCGMESSVFFSLQKEEFVVVIRNNFPIEKITLNASLFVVYIDNVPLLHSL